MSKFEATFKINGTPYTAKIVTVESEYTDSGFTDELRVLDSAGEDVTWNNFGYPDLPESLKAGDTVLYLYHDSIKWLQVERVTKTQVVADGRRYMRRSGKEVGKEVSESRWTRITNELAGFNLKYLATRMARELHHSHEQSQRRALLTQKIVDACRAASLHRLERALRELT